MQSLSLQLPVACFPASPKCIAVQQKVDSDKQKTALPLNVHISSTLQMSKPHLLPIAPKPPALPEVQVAVQPTCVTTPASTLAKLSGVRLGHSQPNAEKNLNAMEQSKTTPGQMPQKKKRCSAAEINTDSLEYDFKIPGVGKTFPSLAVVVRP